MAQLVDVLCDRFEQAWQNKLADSESCKRPSIATYMEDIRGDQRTELLERLLHIDVRYREESGEVCKATDYLPAFPDDVSVIRRALGSDDASLDLCLSIGDQAQPATMLRQSSEDLEGETIGSFRLLQKIGEGGMGIVYMAQQTKPVVRRVALKIVKPGMDSKEVIARFEAERQALAMMDHPNIAKVLDGGMTDSGRPYFVMEYVGGIPITQYCQQQKVPFRRRLEMFLPVCHAVQHAHHKGIIHRDIKPSNVLVALIDDQPVPKVIDFGVAKALNARLTDKTMFTRLGQLIGTFEYMSPEQARLQSARC